MIVRGISIARLRFLPFRWQAVLALSLLTAAYLVHFYYCAMSALPEFSELFVNSDMYGNLQWARQITEQGWLNPHPYHHFVDFMKEVAPYETWMRWYGGEAIFQRSPLFTYVLAAFLKLSPNLLFYHLFQCLSGVLLCALIGILARVTFENRAIGWLAFAISGIYAPFYVYAWPLIRDFLSWNIIVASMLTLTLWWRAWNVRPPSWRLSMLTGFLLGLGFLSRETFSPIIMLGFLLMAVKSFRHQSYRPFLSAVIFTALTVSPLAYRNAMAGAPLLSSSNRFAECFIVGNAASGEPHLPSLPVEFGDLLRKSDGKKWAVIRETLATHRDHPMGLVTLQIRKVLALFDPFEASDNLSYYFMEDISPLVRWGLPHWLILIPGIGGLLLGIRRRDTRQIWFWLFMFTMLAGLASTRPISRYRQTLALLWIPWCSYFVVSAWEAARQGHARRNVSLALGFLVVGWCLCLGPLARHPRSHYHRPLEYDLAAYIYELQGEKENARWIRERYDERMRNSRPRNQ